MDNPINTPPVGVPYTIENARDRDMEEVQAHFQRQAQEAQRSVTYRPPTIPLNPPILKGPIPRW